MLHKDITMANYSIKDLEQLSGIKAHTIRIWEQRYNLLTPERTETNFRYYDDEQLKKLINAVSLLRAGMKISKIGKLSPEAMKEKLAEIHEDNLPHSSQYDIYVNDLITSGLTFDEPAFENAFSTAVERFSFYTTIKDVIYPMLLKVGLMWGKNDMNPAQEHFISNLIKQKIYAAIDHLPINKNKQVDCLLYLPQWEDHEIGMLVSYYLLKKNSIKCINLGQKVPFENLMETIEYCKPKKVFTFFVVTHPIEEAQKQIDSLASMFKDTSFYYAGSQWMLKELNCPKNCTIINDLENFTATFNIKT